MKVNYTLFSCVFSHMFWPCPRSFFLKKTQKPKNYAALNGVLSFFSFANRNKRSLNTSSEAIVVHCGCCYIFQGWKEKKKMKSSLIKGFNDGDPEART